MDQTNSVIYLDNNATTRVDPLVIDAMLPYLTENFANANSTHRFGLGANEAVMSARSKVARLIEAEVTEIIFTSGATEAINLAIKGVAEYYKNKGKHIVTASTEHSAVLDTCRYLEGIGYEITYLPVENDGLLDISRVKNAIRDDTILVTIMYANNETGVLQDIKQIAELTHEAGALFMTDATQAIGKLPINVDKLGIDLLTLSGHKLYAPKGVGALFVRQRVPRRVKLPALLHGGGHEKGIRSGTLNVPGIVALGKACELAQFEMLKTSARIEGLRNLLENELLEIQGAKVNGSLVKRIYNVTNICFDGIDSDAMIMGLSNPESLRDPLIAVSNGSACTSTSIFPSHVLIAMGLSEQESYNSIRFSFGKFNTQREVEIVVNIVRKIVNNLRAMV